MQVFTESAKLQQYLFSCRQNLQTVGFVPTMGALHEGHVTLIEKSKNENDLTVCSIYVNPTQFNNQQDLINYPRRLEEDKKILDDHACDVLFVPSDQEMYKETPVLKLNFGHLEKAMEGQYRERPL